MSTEVDDEILTLINENICKRTMYMKTTDDSDDLKRFFESMYLLVKKLPKLRQLAIRKAVFQCVSEHQQEDELEKLVAEN